MSNERNIMSLATRSFTFLKDITKSTISYLAGLILVRPYLSKNRTIRSFIFKTINITTSTFVYAKPKSEHYLVKSSDMGIGRPLFIDGEYDFDKFIQALNVCNKNPNGRKKPTILIDVGANIGTICIPAVARGFVQRAVAIEPEPLNCNLLRANIALNGLSNSILVYECGLAASKDIDLVLELSESNLGDHRTWVDTDNGAERRNIVHVKSETLDDLCSPADYADSLLWMDIQGYEGFALSGGKELLKSRIPLAIEFWPYGMNRAGSFDALKSAVAHYNGYFDLNNPAKMHSIDSLDELSKTIGDGVHCGRDVLFL
jgi:FkbM family methyltransferase